MTFIFLRRVANPKSFYQISRRNIYVLGIESSCDDTSAAVVNDSRTIIGKAHFSQSRIHIEAGGIIPILASNLHRQYLKKVVEASMEQSLMEIRDLSAIAVTVKPGLIMSLQRGLEYAKNLCSLYSKPLIPIHHMEAHALTARLTDDVKFPFLTFLISGGHCIIALAKSVDKFYRLGSTIDLPPGNVLDKIARRAKLKNLKHLKGLVGGVAIERAALGGDPLKFNFTQPNITSKDKNCNFSFSKFYDVAQGHIAKEEFKLKLGPDEVIPDINSLCAGVLQSMARHLCQKLEVAFHYVQMKELLKGDEKCLVVSGGVACNKFFQKALRNVCDEYEFKMVVPSDELCTDNGVMIAWNGMERLKENLPVVQPDSLTSVEPEALCPLGEDISDDVQKLGKQMTFSFTKCRRFDATN